MTDQAPWTTDHQPHILLHTEARPGAPDRDGTRWTERRPTGLGTALCSCGYTTGLLAREQLPDLLEFIREHPPYGWVEPAYLTATEGAAS